MAEQAEAWRAGEIGVPDAAHAAIHGAELVAGTLCHAPPGLASRPLQGVMQSLFSLCEECVVGCRYQIGRAHV